MNITSRHSAVRPDAGSVGSELARLLRDDALPLPELPDGAARVAALSGSPPARGRALAEIVAGNDPLQSRLMLVGRHAAADSGPRLHTPQDVIGWIGPAEAGDIVYTASLQDALFHEHPDHATARRLWRVGIAAAIWSREAAALARRRSRLVYACGLLHDVGKPMTALACASLAERFEVVLDEAAVAELVHEHHQAVAQSLARRWKLPVAVVHCMQDRHDGSLGGREQREWPVVHLGHHLAELVAEQGPEFAREALTSDPVLNVLNIGPDRFRGLVDRVDWVTRQVEAY